MKEIERVEQAQRLVNTTVEALRDCGLFTEIFLGASVNGIDDQGGRYVPLVSTSTLDKLPLHNFLAQCQAILLETEIQKSKSLEDKSEQLMIE